MSVELVGKGQRACISTRQTRLGMARAPLVPLLVLTGWGSRKVYAPVVVTVAYLVAVRRSLSMELAPVLWTKSNLPTSTPELR